MRGLVLRLPAPQPESLEARLARERRWIFEQRGLPDPDDYPYGDHVFDRERNYDHVARGLPVPRAVWELQC
eukprot:3565989-Amphidinium_carterae.1